MILVLRRTAIFIAIVLAWALLAAAVAHSTGALFGADPRAQRGGSER